MILSIKVLALPAPVVWAVWPMPRLNFTQGREALKLSPDFSITFGNINQSSFLLPDLYAAVNDTKSALATLSPQRLVADPSSDNGVVCHASILHNLTMYFTVLTEPIKDISEEATLPLDQRREWYRLNVSTDGYEAILTSNSTLGMLRGLTTFEQLWYSLGQDIYTTQAPIYIEDEPEYPYRGFMLDTSRNYFSVHDINRTLYAMSMAKLNTFHWHIVDSQSFPLQVPGFEDIASKGAYAQEMYSPQDVRGVVSYAAARGIDVLVEIDTPGHSAAIAQSHPEHVACSQAMPWATYANEPPAGQLRITSPQTVNFTATLLTETAKLFRSSLFSTGGDEINMECYKNDNNTRQDLASNNGTIEDALDLFVQDTHQPLHDMNKTIVVWEDTILNHTVTLANSTIVMVWASSQSASAVTGKGFNIIHVPSDYFYLDCGAGRWIGPDHSNNWQSWCDPFKTWQRAYSFNPRSDLTDTQAELVLGGAQALWTEQTDSSNLESVVWPRAASSAEVFWTGETFPDGSNRTDNLDDALARLHDLRYRMVQRGIRATPLQPHWCAIHSGLCPFAVMLN